MSHRMWITVRLTFIGALAAIGGCCTANVATDAWPMTAAADPTHVHVGKRCVTVVEMTSHPVVANDYSRRFVFDTAGNPKLTQLRKQEKLDDVVKGGDDEFDRQVKLLDWSYRRIRKFGRPTSQATGALDIVKAVDEGHTFFCVHYARLFVSASASMGWIARPMALRKAKSGGGAPEHTITEIWSNQYAKWVLMDPTYAMYAEADGVPLNAYEVRQRWLHRDGEGLTFVLGAERARYTKADLPVFRATHAGYGDLTLTGATLDKLAFLAYIPNTNLMDAPYDYSNMFITKDALCDGVAWHNRDNPADPASEPYFPLDQAALTLTPAGDDLAVDVKTFTPNFSHFEHRFDGADWRQAPPDGWPLHRGRNTLDVVSVNLFGVRGPVSNVVLDVR